MDKGTLVLLAIILIMAVVAVAVLLGLSATGQADFAGMGDMAH